MSVFNMKNMSVKKLCLGAALTLSVAMPGALLAQSYGSGTKTEAAAAQTQDIASVYDALLGRYVSAPDAVGLHHFDYAALKASEADLETLANYIADLEAQNPEEMSDAEATAYWANLYNAVTVRVIVENYPVTSILKIRSGLRPGPWKRKIITVNDESLSLDNVEHDILRKQFPSPLIHYMVNCASIGCPNLKAGIWKAETLNEDRDVAARAFVNSPRGAEITPKGLKVSSIYKWFKEDFGGDKAGTLKHLREYADADLAAAIDGGAKITGFDYDWSLNE